MSDYSNEAILAEISRVATIITSPKLSLTEFRKHSRVSPHTVRRRFGSWEKALEAFIARVNSDTASEEPDVQAASFHDAKTKNKQVPESEQHDIRLGLRYSILNRDSFRCVACGRSPATHLGLVLHVDHIMPFSKGGKTVYENLRSLCQDCNLGKGSKHG